MTSAPVLERDAVVGAVRRGRQPHRWLGRWPGSLRPRVGLMLLILVWGSLVSTQTIN